MSPASRRTASADSGNPKSPAAPWSACHRCRAGRRRPVPFRRGQPGRRPATRVPTGVGLPVAGGAGHRQGSSAVRSSAAPSLSRLNRRARTVRLLRDLQLSPCSYCSASRSPASGSSRCGRCMAAACKPRTVSRGLLGQHRLRLRALGGGGGLGQFSVGVGDHPRRCLSCALDSARRLHRRPGRRDPLLRFIQPRGEIRVLRHERPLVPLPSGTSWAYSCRTGHSPGPLARV